MLHSKDEVMHKFKTYRNEIELHFETFVKCLRADKHGEYYDINYFESTGIKHEVSALYTPQQNDITKRKKKSKF